MLTVRVLYILFPKTSKTMLDLCPKCGQEPCVCPATPVAPTEEQSGSVTPPPAEPTPPTTPTTPAA